MTPYYSENGIVIYNADCRDVIPALQPADLVLVTDPPYGLELGTGDQRGGIHNLGKRGYASYEDTFENFCAVIVPIVKRALLISKRAAIFTGPHFQQLPPAAVLGGIYCPSAMGRTPWGFHNFLPVLFYGTAPNANKGSLPTVLVSTVAAEKNGHPCPKPLPWMKWLVRRAAHTGCTILDPFAGSGTTLRAAKDLGLKAIGIEIEERYCAIAVERLRQQVLPMYEEVIDD